MALSKEQLCRVDFRTWLENRWVLPSGESYSFKLHEYLIAIAEHQWKKGDQVFVEKPAQVGVSELAVAWLPWMNDRELPSYQGVGYFFPATKQLHDHMKARFFPAFDHENPRSKILRGKLGVANLGFVNYNKKPIYFRGGQTRRDMISMSLDAAVIDEFDEFENPISVVPTLEARFLHSKYGYLFGMSTPTVPETGIDQAFTLSNQHNWYVKCQKCYKEFSPLLEVKSTGIQNCIGRSENKDVYGFRCPHCHELTQPNEVPGRWNLDEVKDNQKYAYGVSRLFVPGHSIKKIYLAYEDCLNEQEFYNSILGIAYASSNARLKRADIVDSAIGPEKHFANSPDPTWCGIDVGKLCHWVVGKINESGKKQILAYGQCSFDELKQVVVRYSVKYLVIDLRPYEHEVKKFIGGNRAFMACDFNTGNQEDLYKIITVDEDTRGATQRIIKADKTQLSDLLINEVAAKKNFIFPGSTRGDEQFIKQMCAPVRMDKTNKETGDIKAVYGNGGRGDHYFYACAYLLLAFQLKRNVTVRLSNKIF